MLEGVYQEVKAGKIHVGAAMYIDALKGPSLLSLTFQNDKLDVVRGLQYFIKTIKSFKAVLLLTKTQWSGPQ